MSSETWQHGEKENGREIFSKGFFKREEIVASITQTFLLFDSLRKVLSELRILKLVVIRFQSGNGWKSPYFRFEVAMLNRR